jgi:CHAT domain-containing protein
MAKWLYLFVPCLFVLIMAAPAAGQQADAAKQAFELYLHGKVRQAAQMMQGASDAASSLDDRIVLQIAAADMCTTAADWDCVGRDVDSAMRLILANPQFNRYRSRLLANWLRLKIWHKDDAAVGDYLHNPQALALANSVQDPADLAMVQLALHDWYASKNDLTAAERSLARARTALLRMDVRYSDYGKARILVDLIQSLRFGKDIAGATALALRVGAFIAKSVPADSPVYAKYVFEVAQLTSYAHGYEGVAASFKQAIALNEHLDISDEEKTYRLAIANGMASTALMLAHKTDEARAVHARHPLQAHKGEILARGSFASMAEFYFAVSDVLIGVGRQDAPDQRWKPLFDKDVDWPMDAVARREFEAFRNFARGKLLIWDPIQVVDGIRFLKLAARQRLDNYDAALRAGFEGAPLPNLLDMIIVESGLEGATRGVDRDALGLMLAGGEMLWPAMHHTLVDAAILLDSQDDAAARRDAKSYLELLRRKRAWEVERIGAALEGNTSLNRTELDRQYTDTVAALATLKDRLQRNPKLAPAKGLPTLDDLQRALAPDDAYVSYFPVLDGLGKLCITPSNVTFAVAPFTPSIQPAIKLIEFATTASHPPDPVLDAQFPVSAAVHVHDFLFQGLEACLRPDTHVTVALPDAAAGVPLGALLATAPSRMGEGYDLAKAHWLIRDVDFSRVLSARQYLATTRYLRRAPAPRAYLGIGDPKLDRTHVAPPASAAAVRGVRAVQALTGLGELPETAEELEAVATLLHAPAEDVLLGDAATEWALRQKPLAEYDILHVASHGLLAADLPGLTEPALVLTPMNAEDPSDDGVLTVSEIAQLSLNARLVVLSACNTAKLSMATATSGVQDLQTAFTVAGAPTLLASLWPLDSATARDVVVRFFAEWRTPQGGGAAEALAHATRAYLAAADAPHQHPRFWASFVVLGNGDVRGTADSASVTPADERAPTSSGAGVPSRAVPVGAVGP